MEDVSENMGRNQKVSAASTTQPVAVSKKQSQSVSTLTTLKELATDYQSNTPIKLKIIDVYLLYILLTGGFQFIYCCLVGTFPFNAFLGGFISCVGSFIFAVCLRMHSNPQNKNLFSDWLPERAFADFIFAHVVMHLVIMNFIG